MFDLPEKYLENYKEMNIWYLSAYDQPRGQSARTYVFSMELAKRGHQVTMFTNSYCHWTHTEKLADGEKWRVENIDGVRVVWLKTVHYSGNGIKRGLNMLSNACRSLQVARIFADTPDVVIGPSVPLFTGMAARMIASIKKAAFVFEVRDVWPQALVDLGYMKKSSPVYCLFRFMEKYLYRKATRISAVLPITCLHVEKSGQNPEKVSWIPNGVNIDRFKNLPPYDGGKPDGLVVMYVGGFAATHDVDSIVKTAQILSSENITSVMFIIAGQGPGKANCMSEAVRLGLKNIVFHDPVPKNLVPEFQLQADVFIASVKDSPVYQFGINSNKIYDYFSSGRPVIFSGNAPNDPVRESGCGYSIPPENPAAMADALKKYIELTPDQRIAMGRRGREWVEKYFNMEMLGERMETLLKQAVEEKEKGK